jgi:hypothetical protein
MKLELKKLAKRKKIKEEIRHFYDGAETTTLTIPGAGFYNPHLDIKPVPKPTRKDHHWWVGEHKKLASK